MAYFHIFYIEESCNIYGEIKIIELTQFALLIRILFINYKIYKNKSNRFTKNLLLIRFLIFSLILWEEISFITYGITPFLENYNYQSELNLHNAKFLAGTKLLKNIPIFSNYKFISQISTLYFIYNIFLISFGFGNYIKNFKKFSILFSEKKYSFYFLIFLFNCIISMIFNKINPGGYILDNELVETFIYIIFLLDTNYKFKQLRE